MIKNQKFGVEVEMTGITRKKAADIVAEVLGITCITSRCDLLSHSHNY